MWFDDRPWVEVATDGTVHVIWNDGRGVCHAVSQDGGNTWTERPRIHAQGGSSHLALGPNREVAVRVTPLSASGKKFDEGVDILAGSTDAGTTWQKHAAPGQREWSPDLDTKVTPPRWVEKVQPRWVEPVAWDAQGALYISLDKPRRTLARALIRSGRDVDELACGAESRRPVLPLSGRARPRRTGGDVVFGSGRDAPGACGPVRGQRR